MFLPNHKSYKAFTFIELLVVLAIVVIIAAVALPSFDSITEKKDFRISVDNFATDLRLVRNKALSGVGVGVGNVGSDEGQFGAGDTLLGWGLSSTDCTDTNTGEYNVEFSYIDSSETDTPKKSADVTRSLDPGLSFLIDSGDASLYCGDVFFGKLTGLPASSRKFRIYKINDLDSNGDNKYEAEVTVNSSGQISVEYIAN